MAFAALGDFMTTNPRLRACAAGLAALLAAPLAWAPSSAALVEESTAGQSPVLTSSGGVKNVAFYYDDDVKLHLQSTDANHELLGHPEIVVSNTADKFSPQTAAEIKNMKAVPYKYVQYYWVPEDKEYGGIDLRINPGHAFCLPDGPPITDRAGWRFLDLNEDEVQATIKARMLQLAADGWAGVMIDRGQAATQNAAAADGTPVWNATSACTGTPAIDPIDPAPTFADAYVSLADLAREAELEVMFNNGNSPFDPTKPMRPKSTDPECSAGPWALCDFLDDVWPKVDLVLNESAAVPRDERWERLFRSNRDSERDAERGHRVVALVTSASVGGEDRQNRRNVYYAWSRIKLFNLAVAVNTGHGGCDSPAGTPCNHYGTYPELVDTNFGKPVAAGPSSTACARRSTIRCVWKRQYLKGMNVVNVDSNVARVALPLGVSGCRFVYDVFKDRPLAGNNCVKSVKLELRPWTGRPLIYSKTKWPNPS